MLAPDLMYVQLGSHKYIYNPENAKIYKYTQDHKKGILIGSVNNGKIILDTENKSYSLRKENVIEMIDEQTDQHFYKSRDGTYYEKINEVDGWLVGLDAEQQLRLKSPYSSTI